jgi:hypothetical protein
MEAQDFELQEGVNTIAVCLAFHDLNFRVGPLASPLRGRPGERAGCQSARRNNADTAIIAESQEDRSSLKIDAL